jgi:hypothetical protein
MDTDLSIFDYIPYERVLICEEKWNKLIKPFTKNCKIYFQWIIPTLTDLELYILLTDALLVKHCEVFKKIKIEIISGIPCDVNSGILMTVENLLIYIETDEQVKIFEDQTSNIQKTERNLSNQRYLDNAKPEIVELERKKLIDFNLLQQQNLINKFFNQFGYEFILLLYKYTSLEKIFWHVQYYRELNTEIEEFSPEWFEYVYGNNLVKSEIEALIKNM